MQRNQEEKQMVSRTRAMLSCVFCLILGAAAALLGVYVAVGQEGITLLQADRLIQQKFVGEYDEKEHREATLRAMVASLGDRWSYYVTPEEYRQVVDNRRNTYVGIGITVDPDDRDGILIRSVSEGSPAEEAGLVPGDRIRQVEGTAVTPENRSECVGMIKGEAGTSVTLEVEAPDGTCRTLTVERQHIQNRSAYGTMLEGDVGLITIENFYSGTAELVKQSVEELTEQGARGLILDVRNNPGGYVTELTKILDTLLPEGTTFISRNFEGKEKVYTSDAACVDLPMAVLVNGESYSAAEFLAAQLRESAGAAVVGTETVGKGYSQMLFKLADGSGVGLSTARYFTASGVSLIGVGLTPDPKVELPEKAAILLKQRILPAEQDAQLQAAVQTLGLN